MKTSTESHPRLVCRLIRSWSAVTGDPSSPGAVSRHADHCPACQAFFAASSALDERLRAAAPRHMQSLPAGFDQRLEHALARATRASASSESNSRWVLWSLFGSLAAAAALVFVLLRPAANSPEGLEIAVTPDRPENRVALGGPSSGEVILETMAVNPLQQEIDHVYSDARSALQFLALNFLPASSATASDVPSS
jgi:hypothetical protein